MKFNIKEISQRLKKFRNRDKEKLRFYPKRDWFMLILFFIIFSFILVIFYHFLFTSDYSSPLKNVSPLGNPQDISLENISKTRLNLILRKWEEKQKKFEDLLENRPDFDFL